MTKNSHVYSIKREIPYSHLEALNKTRAALNNQGFEILNEVDVTPLLFNSISSDVLIEISDYTVLSVINPEIAAKVLANESEIGLLIPFNVIIYRNFQYGNVTVSAVDPVPLFGITGREDLNVYAWILKSKLHDAIEKL